MKIESVWKHKIPLGIRICTSRILFFQVWDTYVPTQLPGLCLILCDPTDCSLPGSCVHGILWARILQWVAMPSSRGPFWSRDQIHVSSVYLHRQEGSWPLLEHPGKLHEIHFSSQLRVLPHSLRLTRQSNDNTVIIQLLEPWVTSSIQCGWIQKGRKGKWRSLTPQVPKGWFFILCGYSEMPQQEFPSVFLDSRHTSPDSRLIILPSNPGFWLSIPPDSFC